MTIDKLGLNAINEVCKAAEEDQSAQQACVDGLKTKVEGEIQKSCGYTLNNPQTNANCKAVIQGVWTADPEKLKDDLKQRLSQIPSPKLLAEVDKNFAMLKSEQLPQAVTAIQFFAANNFELLYSDAIPAEKRNAILPLFTERLKLLKEMQDVASDAEKSIKKDLEGMSMRSRMEDLKYTPYRPGPSLNAKGSKVFYGSNDKVNLDYLAEGVKPEAEVRQKLTGIFSPASIVILFSIAATLNTDKFKNMRFNVVGHSPVDRYFDNQHLSERRAYAVYAALIAMGVDKSRIGAYRGEGATHPMYAVTGRENRKNQRVELVPLDAQGNEVLLLPLDPK